MLSYQAYAEFDCAPADTLVALPPSLNAEFFPGEPLGCAMNIFPRARIAAGDTVAIVGVGFLGALLTQLAAGAGARVIALGRRPCGIAAAEAMGAAECVSAADVPGAIQRVKELTNGKFCAVTIEATGKQAPLDLASEITGERGRLVIAGYHQDGPRQINLQLWNWRGLDVINAHERDPRVYFAGMRAAVEAVESGRLLPAPLYTHRFPLTELGAALAMTRERPDGFMKAFVLP